jgi:outer membrane lipoprotein-sorting protein
MDFEPEQLRCEQDPLDRLLTEARWPEPTPEAIHRLRGQWQSLMANPQRFNARARRRVLMRIAGVAVAVVILLAIVSLFLVPQEASFAQALKAINEAETLTYSMTHYIREYSEDGKRSWLRKWRSEIAYQAPDLYRVTAYENDGKVRDVTILDKLSNKTLHLDMKSKKATWKAQPSIQFGRGGPLGGLAKVLESKPIEFVGQREINGVRVNVFRSHHEFDHTSFDIWLDARIKRLVGWSDPGADRFDFATAADRNNPAENKISKGETAGVICSDFVFNPRLDATLFSLTPPEGFEVAKEPPHPPVTEAELIEWLDVTARFNHGAFVDTPLGVHHEKHNEAARKDKASRTDVEQRFLDLWIKHMKNRHSYPIWAFAEANAVPKTFRYLGKGVKLGDKDRIVCWYKLKGAKTYRVVFGDLSMKDVAAEDLPLPVER